MTAALEVGEWSAARPGRTLPLGKTRYPFCRRLSGPPAPVWTSGKFHPHRDSIPNRPAIATELLGPQALPSYCINSIIINNGRCACSVFFSCFLSASSPAVSINRADDGDDRMCRPSGCPLIHSVASLDREQPSYSRP